MRLFRPGFLADCLYPGALFRIKTTERKVYLTFDDGPDPVSTPRLLDILKKYGFQQYSFVTGKPLNNTPNLYILYRSVLILLATMVIAISTAGKLTH